MEKKSATHWLCACLEYISCIVFDIRYQFAALWLQIQLNRLLSNPPIELNRHMHMHSDDVHSSNINSSKKKKKLNVYWFSDELDEKNTSLFQFSFSRRAYNVKYN